MLNPRRLRYLGPSGPSSRPRSVTTRQWWAPLALAPLLGTAALLWTLVPELHHPAPTWPLHLALVVMTGGALAFGALWLWSLTLVVDQAGVSYGMWLYGRRVIAFADLKRITVASVSVPARFGRTDTPCLIIAGRGRVVIQLQLRSFRARDLRAAVRAVVAQAPQIALDDAAQRLLSVP